MTLDSHITIKTHFRKADHEAPGFNALRGDESVDALSVLEKDVGAIASDVRPASKVMLSTQKTGNSCVAHRENGVQILEFAATHNSSLIAFSVVITNEVSEFFTTLLDISFDRGDNLIYVIDFKRHHSFGANIA